ncbi:MAG: Mobile mystery protein [Marmoricola sp.]|nr:Mobile mystery protein [Marmoricola sp.]
MTFGIDPVRVPAAVKDLVDGAKYWFGSDEAGVIEQAAVKCHHKLVGIHPFPNGSGRHACLHTDLLVEAPERVRPDLPTSGHDAAQWPAALAPGYTPIRWSNRSW